MLRQITLIFINLGTCSESRHYLESSSIEKYVQCVSHLLSALSISMVTRTDRAIVMGWRSSNILHDSMFENSGLSSVHLRWLLCESGRDIGREKG